MFRNYLKMAWRNMLNNKLYSALNIVGLAAGMTITMLIGLWIYDELSFNRYHQNYAGIAQVMQNVFRNGDVQTWRDVPVPLADELRKNYGSDFKQVIMCSGTGKHILTFADKKFTEEGEFFEPQAPEMLTLKMLEGTWNGLNDPSSILLSKSVAEAFFGDRDPMGKILKIDNQSDVKVTGVYEDIPYNSSFRDVSFIAPWGLYLISNDWIKKMDDPWGPSIFQIFVQIAPNVDLKKVSSKIKFARLSTANNAGKKRKPELFLYPMSKWHLYSVFKNGSISGGPIEFVWLFGIIGAFVLLLACINFINLSTARSEKRAREVGIRKAIGSARGQLIIQFFVESSLMVIFSFFLSLVLALLIIPFFNEITDMEIHILWGSPMFWALGLGVSILAGLIAGSYPAFYLSSFQPVKVLKGAFRIGRFAALPRKMPVVFQFTISIILIIGTIAVFRQIQFAKDRPAGYSREGLIMLKMLLPDIHNQFDAVRNELKKSGAVDEVSESSAPPTGIWATEGGFEWKGKDPNLTVDFPTTGVSNEFGRTVGWQFKDGRDFSREFISDSSGFVLNEAAVKFMGLTKPVGEIIKWNGRPFKIIGVIKDMIVESPYQLVRPSIYCMAKSHDNYVIIKLNPQLNTREALNKIEGIFKQFSPATPFDYQFVDEEYAKKFANEERIGKLASSFAGLAIFISCLGLFGMASFMAEQRQKEIAMRKVLGATVFRLWALLSKDFILLVVISLFISIPIAYYLMHNWLQKYNYRSGMSWWIFASAAVASFLIVLLTVSYHGIKAALANPVKSLRNQ